MTIVFKSGAAHKIIIIFFKLHLEWAGLDRDTLREVHTKVRVTLDIIQELVVEAAIIVLKVYGWALEDLLILLDILVDSALVFEAGELHGEMQLSVFGGILGGKRGTEKSQVAAWFLLLQVLNHVAKFRRSFQAGA